MACTFSPLIGFTMYSILSLRESCSKKEVGGVAFKTTLTDARRRCDYTFDNSNGIYTVVLQKHWETVPCAESRCEVAPLSCGRYRCETRRFFLAPLSFFLPSCLPLSAVGAISGIETSFRTRLISGEHQRGWRRKDTGGDTLSKHEKSPAWRCARQKCEMCSRGFYLPVYTGWLWNALVSAPHKWLRHSFNGRL